MAYSGLGPACRMMACRRWASGARCTGLVIGKAVLGVRCGWGGWCVRARAGLWWYVGDVPPEGLTLFTSTIPTVRQREVDANKEVDDSQTPDANTAERR